MPLIRVVMPDGTTRPFPEGTSKSKIAAAMRDMIAAMGETPELHEAWRTARRVEVTGVTKPVSPRKSDAKRKDQDIDLPDPPDMELDMPDESYSATYNPKNPWDARREEVEDFERDYKESMNKTGEVMDKSGQVIGALGPKNVGIPLQAGGKALKFKPGQNFVIDKSVKLANFMRDPRPLSSDWMLRSIIGNRAADAVIQARLPQQINNMLGNNAMRANGGLAPRR